jgi:hypothetical protein
VRITPARLFLVWYILYEWALFIPVGYADITAVVGVLSIIWSRYDNGH